VIGGRRPASEGPQRDADQSVGRAWQRYRGIYDVPGRLGRSVIMTVLLSPIGLLMISVARLLVVSDYNPVIASAIVSSVGSVDTFLGSIIPLVPIFAPYLALVLLFFNRVIPALLTFLAVVFISPVAESRASVITLAETEGNLILHHGTIGYLMILFGVIFAFLWFGVLVGQNADAAVRTLGTVACLALIPFVLQVYPFPLSNEFYTQLIKQPWLPPEMITLSSGQVFVGYILSSGTWVEILSEDTRRVHYVRADYVTHLHICRIQTTPLKPPLIALFPSGLNAPAFTPVCHESPAPRRTPLARPTPPPHPAGGRTSRRNHGAL